MERWAMFFATDSQNMGCSTAARMLRHRRRGCTGVGGGAEASRDPNLRTKDPVGSDAIQSTELLATLLARDSSSDTANNNSLGPINLDNPDRKISRDDSSGKEIKGYCPAIPRSTSAPLLIGKTICSQVPVGSLPLSASSPSLNCTHGGERMVRPNPQLIKPGPAQKPISPQLKAQHPFSLPSQSQAHPPFGPKTTLTYHLTPQSNGFGPISRSVHPPANILSNLPAAAELPRQPFLRRLTTTRQLITPDSRRRSSPHTGHVASVNTPTSSLAVRLGAADNNPPTTEARRLSHMTLSDRPQPMVIASAPSANGPSPARPQPPEDGMRGKTAEVDGRDGWKSGA
ncbi:ribosomal RNA small subunit methyltransferase A [Striga asiatica]|uniref:Ribosomal RNA small subunit methyltransferase A n=1 Tax=Striga asiatica TaxID=4170 RepID=A0A5A7QG61_STRAF|nr:ribosomal RNA small subunit methyltransferase A [Striga asiatica]